MSTPTMAPTALAGSVNLSDGGAAALVIVCGVIGLLFAYFQFSKVSQIRLDVTMTTGGLASQAETGADNDAGAKLIDIYNAIREGADSFLIAEYKVCLYFVVGFGAVVFIFTSRSAEGGWDTQVGGLTTLCFVVGALTRSAQMIWLFLKAGG